MRNEYSTAPKIKKAVKRKFVNSTYGDKVINSIPPVTLCELWHSETGIRRMPI
jgi:hypothetical protein